MMMMNGTHRHWYDAWSWLCALHIMVSLFILAERSSQHSRNANIHGTSVYNHAASKAIIRANGEAVPVTGHGGTQGCEASRLPHCLDNHLTDGGEVFSFTSPAVQRDS
jgi:hypothetical protein